MQPAASDRHKRSKAGRVLDAAVWGVVIGAAGGAVLGAGVDAIGAALGALIGAAVFAPAEVLTVLRRTAAQPKPLWERILGSVLLMAIFGWVLGLVIGDDHAILTAGISGGLLGLLGLRLPLQRLHATRVLGALLLLARLGDEAVAAPVHRLDATLGLAVVADRLAREHDAVAECPVADVAIGPEPLQQTVRIEQLGEFSRS